jgi:hypothetical protein
MPAFPGAYSQGRTKAQAYRNLLVAIMDLVQTYTLLSRRRARRVA